MNKLLPYLLLFIFLIPLMERIAIYTDFAVNHEYIKTVLCINKDKPELKCNGQCHLKNELKETEKKEKETQKVPKSEISIQTPPVQIKLAEQVYVICLKLPVYIVNTMYYSDFLSDIFHPPQTEFNIT